MKVTNTNYATIEELKQNLNLSDIDTSKTLIRGNVYMKIKVILTVTALVCSLQADTISDAFKEAKVDGEVRVVHYSRSADDSKNKFGDTIFSEASGVAIGGNLGISTAPINDFKANFRFYTTNPIDADDDLMPPTYLVDGTEGYSILGEANLEYNNGTTMLKAGRQALKTPLVASDDARVVKDLFEAVHISTKVIPDTTLHALYIHRNSGMDNGSSNYNSNVSAKDFVSMSETLGTSYDKGMAVVGVENESMKDIKLSAWYYYGIDLVDMYYVDASYSTKISNIGFKLEAHYWDISSQNEYEVDTDKKIDYNYGGVRATAAYNDYVFQLAQEQINYADETVGIHTAWGMYSEYTYGFLMGSGIYGALNGMGGDYVKKVDATKITAIYNFTKDIMLYGSYNWWKTDNDEFQSDLETLDILLAWPCQFVDNAAWQVVYENWNSDSNNIMVDNNLVRAKFTYTF